MPGPKSQKVKVLSAFYVRGRIVGAGSVITLSTPEAIEMRSARKCEFVASDVKEQSNEEPKKPVAATQPDSAPTEKPEAKSGK